MKYLIFTFVTILLSASANAQINIDSMVMEHVYSGNTEAAISILQKKEAENVTTDEALLLMRLYVGQNSFRKVREIFESKHELFKIAEAHYLIGQAYSGLGQRRDAIDAYEIARLLDSSHIQVRLQLSRLYMDDRNWRQAQHVQAEILALLPDNLHIKTQHARALRNLKREDEAIDNLLEVLESDETYYLALTDLALLYFMTGNNAEGRKTIQKAIEYYPKDDYVWDISARIAFNQKQFRLAASHWKNAVSHGNSEVSTLRNIGLSYYQFNDFDTALAYFIQVIDQEPDDVQALMYSAVIYRQREDWIRAQNVLDHLYFLQNDAFFAETLVQRAVSREGLQNLAGAMQDYELASKLNPENGIYYYYMATMLERNKVSLNQAVTFYEKFLSFEDRADQLLIDQSKARVKSLRERIFFRGE